MCTLYAPLGMPAITILLMQNDAQNDARVDARVDAK